MRPGNYRTVEAEALTFLRDILKLFLFTNKWIIKKYLARKRTDSKVRVNKTVVLWKTTERSTVSQTHGRRKYLKKSFYINQPGFEPETSEIGNTMKGEMQATQPRRALNYYCHSSYYSRIVFVFLNWYCTGDLCCVFTTRRIANSRGYT